MICELYWTYEKGYVAFSDYCTHKGASLADGALICGTVQCPCMDRRLM